MSASVRVFSCLCTQLCNVSAFQLNVTISAIHIITWYHSNSRFYPQPLSGYLNDAPKCRDKNHKKLCYCRETVRRAMLVNSCYVSQGMGVRKVSNSKSDLQDHWQWCHSIGHRRFPISVPLQLCLYFAPLMRYYHLFPKV